MGTPEFAVASLNALLTEGYNVVGVVTAPDKPAGRGLKLQQSAVKQFAEQHGLTILQPAKLKDPEFLSQLKALNADLQVVVAFRMLPELVWNMPPMGTLNVHASLLPQYRGAAPINWAIINGETETGVTTFKLQHAIDTGDVLLQQPVTIAPNQTAGELHDSLKTAGAALLVNTIAGLINGTVAEQPQTLLASLTTLKHAPKIYADTCCINANLPVAEVHNLVRGLSPFPGAFTQLEGKVLKLFKTIPLAGPLQHEPGQFATDGKLFLHLACADGYLNILELQLEGKKRMDVEDFLRGFKWN
ncbi:MAG: methionyl-tRNA formyltransferase [Bacteroidetes bacterium]|nr:MAG: methionyl-tRNA formyltransferase [Bacteroidota bacterium]